MDHEMCKHELLVIAHTVELTNSSSLEQIKSIVHKLTVINVLT